MNTTSANQEDVIRTTIIGTFQRHPVGGNSQLDSLEGVAGSYLPVPPEGDRAALPHPQELDAMMARWDEITKALQDDEDFDLRPPVYVAGLRAIFEIADFLRTYGGLPHPDIFIIRPGDVSFEWQPHITRNLFASISFAQSGGSVELDIHRVEADGEIRTLYSDSRTSADSLRTFLLHLHAAAVQ